MSTTIVWFRRDLRLADHPALETALRLHDHVLPVYVHAPEEEAPWQPGAASQWWLHHSLAALDAALRRRGSGLHIARGDSLAVLQQLAEASGADALYWHRLYEPALIARDRRIKHTLRDAGLTVQSSNGALMVEPWDIQTQQGQPYKVFTPFWRTLRAQLQPSPTAVAPKRIATQKIAGGLALSELDLLPHIAWDGGFAEAWKPGEAGAMAALEEFFDHAVLDYKAARDVPSVAGTSRLSPHLHFGEISPQQVLSYVEERAQAEPERAERLRAAAEPFLRELGWRDFSYNLLFHFPHTPEKNLNPQFDRFPWARQNAKALARWQRGRTGIPIVDAGMRELWNTGWMHNRVRMLVASFLTKNLRLHWSHGARWFWDTLVDADLANNTQGWQWTAGSGADASPYFRIFNPVTQGERFDPQGDYVRRWVPELAALGAKDIHAPWKTPGLVRRCGYVEPMVDLAASRDAALGAYQSLRA